MTALFACLLVHCAPRRVVEQVATAHDAPVGAIVGTIDPKLVGLFVRVNSVAR